MGKFDGYLAKYNPRTLARQHPCDDLLNSLALTGMCNLLTRAGCLADGEDGSVIDGIMKGSGGFLIQGSSTAFKLRLGLVASLLESGARPVPQANDDDCTD